jgi:hypothetical protein
MPGEAKPFTRFVGAVDEVHDHFEFAEVSAVRYTTT